LKIQNQDFYHGVALTQIVEHPSFKALNKGSTKYGHYLINADCHLFVRYATNEGPVWNYTLTVEQLSSISSIIESKVRVFVCLVCGEETVCLVNQEQLGIAIDLQSSDSQWLKVEVPPNGSCRVTGSQKKLSGVIPHNAFPKKLFA